MSNLGRLFACANRPFTSQFPERFSNSSSFFVVMVYYHPCPRRVARASLSLGQTGPPSLTLLGTVPRCLTTLAPATSCARYPARLSSGILLNLLSRTFSSQFLLGPPARLAFLSRDPAACFRYARFPCPYRNHSFHRVKTGLGCDSTPGSLAPRCGLRLTPANSLMSRL